MGLSREEHAILSDFEMLKLMIHKDEAHGGQPVSVLIGKDGGEIPGRLGPTGIAAVLAAVLVAIMPDNYPETVRQAVEEVWEKALAGDFQAAANLIRRVGVVMGRPWRLQDAFPILPPHIREALSPLVDGSDPITRAAVDPADNGLLVHLRRTRPSVSPASFVARAIWGQNVLQGEGRRPAEVDPGLLAQDREIQDITEQIFGLLAAFLLDARMVLFVGPSGCGKTLMQMLLLRYIVDRWGDVVRHVVVLDAHPELYGLIRRIVPPSVLVTYRIISPDRIQEIGLVLNTTAPDVVVFQEANSLSEGAVEQAARAAITCGVPLTLTTYAEMPPILTDANAMEVAFGAVPVIAARLGSAAGGLTPTVCVVYPAALWVWQIRLGLGPSGNAVGVHSLTRLERWKIHPYGELWVPVPNLDAVDQGTAGKYLTDFLNQCSR